MSSNLSKDNKIISFNGVIGRKHYLINLSIAVIVGLIAFAALGMPLRMPKIAVSLFYLVSAALLVIVVLSNHVRRFRDIRGTRKSEVIWGIILLVSLGVPIINILALVFLSVKEGAITGQANPMFAQDLEGVAASRVDSMVDSVAVSIHDRGKKASSANEIEKLHELKEKGILTEDEFNKKKEELLKGA